MRGFPNTNIIIRMCELLKILISGFDVRVEAEARLICFGLIENDELFIHRRGLPARFSNTLLPWLITTYEMID